MCNLLSLFSSLPPSLTLQRVHAPTIRFLLFHLRRHHRFPLFYSRKIRIFFCALFPPRHDSPFLPPQRKKKFSRPSHQFGTKKVIGNFLFAKFNIRVMEACCCSPFLQISKISPHPCRSVVLPGGRGSRGGQTARSGCGRCGETPGKIKNSHHSISLKCLISNRVKYQRFLQLLRWRPLGG